MYDQGYTPTATCENNICERMYFEIGQEETQIHNINNQQITFKTEKVLDGRTIFHINELTDRAGGGMQDLKSDLKSKYGFIVSDASYIYENPFANHEDLIVTGHGVNIEESEYCPQDCMEGLGKINIKKGWNILNEEIVTDLRLYNLNDDFNYEEDISVVYQYMPVLNKYLLTKPRDNSNEEKIINEFISKVGESKAEEILEQRGKAVWAYSTKKATVYYKQDSVKLFSGIESIKLFSGWNFIAIASEMNDKTLDEIRGGCNIKSAYAWNNEIYAGHDSPSWESIYDESIFNSEIIGLGMIVKVTDDCNFGDVIGSITSPPAIPGSENSIPSESTDKTCIDEEGYVLESNEDNEMIQYLDHCVKISDMNNYITIVDGVYYNSVSSDCPSESCFSADGGDCEGEGCFLAKGFCEGNNQKYQITECAKCDKGACL